MKDLRNRVQLIGNLGMDPEVKSFDGGRKLAETAEKYLKKGSEVALEGKLVYRSYETKEGQTKYITEIVLNDFMMFSKKQS